MKSKIIILLSILFIVACSEKTIKQAENKNNNGKIMKGKIVYINFTDKGGRVHENIGDYFFEDTENQYFIKFTKSTVSQDEIAKFKDKEIEISGEIEDGLWDTDDPNVQSRIGEYVIIYEILK